MVTDRERIVELVRRMRENTVAKGCTPAEAAMFASKAAEWVEKHQIREEELRVKGEGPPREKPIQTTIKTGKRVFNPGWTEVVNAMARAMCCECIMWHERDGAVYGVIGDPLDAAYVAEVAPIVATELEVMATMEGREHGEEKAGLVRWRNQYLAGAAGVIRRRIEEDRGARSAARVEEARREAAPGTALVVVTGAALVEAKRTASKEAMHAMHKVKKGPPSRMGYDATARDRGRIAGKTVGLNRQLD